MKKLPLNTPNIIQISSNPIQNHRNQIKSRSDTQKEFHAIREMKKLPLNTPNIIQISSNPIQNHPNQIKSRSEASKSTQNHRNQIKSSS
jgi:hypothetical protein